MPAANPTKAALLRAIEAWKAAGLQIGGMEVLKDGTIRILAAMDKTPEPAHRKGPKPWPIR
ncbi:MAG: hypothetical protein JG765_2173 [Cereibacter sp.]|nr:hypothetical protein [Cereibacter sp.]